MYSIWIQSCVIGIRISLDFANLVIFEKFIVTDGLSKALLVLELDGMCLIFK